MPKLKNSNETFWVIFKQCVPPQIGLIYFPFLQKLQVCMKIITTMKNAWNATVVAWICLAPIKNEREDSKIKSFAISILRIWLWWRVQISCSSLETSSLKVWDVLWLEGKAPPRSFFPFHLKLAQVTIKSLLVSNSHPWELDIWTFDNWTVDNWTPDFWSSGQLICCTSELLDNWIFGHLNFCSVIQKFSCPEVQLSTAYY